MHGHQIPQLPSMPVSLQLNRDRAAVRSGPVIARNSPLTLQSNDHSGMLFPHLFHPCEQADKNLQSIQHPAMAIPTAQCPCHPPDASEHPAPLEQNCQSQKGFRTKSSEAGRGSICEAIKFIKSLEWLLQNTPGLTP